MRSMLPSLLLFAGVLAPAAEATTEAKPIPYPLKTCIVSGEALDSMGAPVVFVREGRELKVCCKGCIKGFDKEPARYLKKLPNAPAAQP